MTNIYNLFENNCEAKKAAILKKIEDMCTELHKYSDSVRIFVNFYDERTGETHSITSGTGNYFAQFGHVKEWVKIQEEGSNVKDD